MSCDETVTLYKLCGEQFTPTDKPKRVGSYILGRILGEGKWGTVREASRDGQQGKVAVKSVFKYRSSKGDTQRQCFRREVDSLRHLRHPNIVCLYETMETARHMYLVMELIDGQTLAKCLRHRNPLPEEVTQTIMYQLSLAVSHVHQCGIIHRDVKPANILVTRERTQVKLIGSMDCPLRLDGIGPFQGRDGDKYIMCELPSIPSSPCEDPVQSKECFISILHISECGLSTEYADFGLSTPFHPEVPQTRQCGTPVYCAPEIYSGTQHGPPADIWSLGVVLFEMLTGKTPFVSDRPRNMTQLYGTILKTVVVPDSMNTECASLLKSLLQINAASRPTGQQLICHPWIRAHSIIQDKNDKTAKYQKLDFTFMKESEPIKNQYCDSVRLFKTEKHKTES